MNYRNHCDVDNMVENPTLFRLQQRQIPKNSLKTPEMRQNATLLFKFNSKIHFINTT